MTEFPSQNPPPTVAGLSKAFLSWFMSASCTQDLPLNATAVLSGQDAMWLLIEGSVEVFVAERPGGQSLGSRRYMLSATAPAVLCGLPQGDGEAPLDVMVVSRGARALVVEDAAFFAQPVPDVAAGGVGKLLDTWVSGLTRGLVQDFVARTATSSTLAVGETLAVADDHVIGAAKGVVWARLVEGEARFLGVVPVVRDDVVPLTGESWLIDGKGLQLAGMGSMGVVRKAEWWGQMQAFHRWVMAGLCLRVTKNYQHEAWRLDKRDDRTAHGMDAALGKLARLVGVYDRPKPAADPDNVLIEACSVLFESLGITLEPTAEMKRRRTGDAELTVEDVARVARVRPRQLALRDAWWRQDNGPLLAFADEDGRPLALVPRAAGGYVVHDVALGKQQPLTAALAHSLAPLAWTFFAPLPPGKLKVSDLLAFGLRRQKRDVMTALLAGALGGLLALAIPLATGMIFQHIIPGHHSAQLLQVGLALVLVAAVSCIVKISSDVALLRIEGRMAGQLQAGVIDRLLRLPSNFFSRYSTGDLAQRTLMIEAVRKSVTGLVLSSVLAGIFSLFSFALLFWYQPFAALAAGLLFLLLLAASVLAGMMQLKAIMEGEQLAGNIMGLTLQMISGMQKLRMAGAENRAFVLWGGIFAEMRSRMVRSRRVVNAYGVFMAGWDLLSLVVVFLIMAVVAGEDLETGMFLAFVSAFTMFMGSMNQVARAVMQCYAVVPLIRRAQPLLDAIPEVDVNNAAPGQLSGDIEINQVYFRYDRDSPRVLSGLSLQVKPGEFVALVGPSGCGKSTLMKLVLGFERPESGGVFLDGRDLRTLDIQAVRRQIGVVLQTGRVMPGSIYENIKGATPASVDEAWEAAKMAGLDGDIQAMPMGMHTVLTEGTAALSGGQLQRLLIARALVSKPRLVLFDEATSALDNQTQAVVTASLARLSVTRIAIAHRLSTVKDADRIFVIDDGKVSESGSYEQLMAKNGLFAQLARRQLA
jgi:NHLM bacteriocin system ABC transporter ATP-binding protein